MLSAVQSGQLVLSGPFIRVSRCYSSVLQPPLARERIGSRTSPLRLRSGRVRASAEGSMIMLSRLPSPSWCAAVRTRYIAPSLSRRLGLSSARRCHIPSRRLITQALSPSSKKRLLSYSGFSFENSVSSVRQTMMPLKYKVDGHYVILTFFWLFLSLCSPPFLFIFPGKPASV